MPGHGRRGCNALAGGPRSRRGCRSHTLAQHVAMTTAPDRDQPLPDNARLNELEVKLSFAEDLLETLNATVYRQQQQIDRLQREMRELREQLVAAAPLETRNPREELPPHY